jgi:hypothetical protein
MINTNIEKSTFTENIVNKFVPDDCVHTQVIDSKYHEKF